MNELLAEYRRHLEDLARTPATIATYMDLLTRMDRELPVGLNAACEEELREWIYTGGRSRATRGLYRTVAAGYFAWACDPDDPRLDYDPARRLPKVTARPGTPRPVARGQLADILARARAPYRIWFLIAALAGARCIELAAMDRDDIGERTILLHGKGEKPRLVPTHPRLWELVATLPAGPVSADADGRRLSRVQVSHRGNHQLRNVLGHRDVSMHRLRHTFLTGAYDACRDLRAVQELAGHASPATTARYVQVGEDAMRSAVAGLTW